MDKLIADVKKVLEESDPTITVEESLPPSKPNGAGPDLDNEPWLLRSFSHKGLICPTESFLSLMTLNTLQSRESACDSRQWQSSKREPSACSALSAWTRGKFTKRDFEAPLLEWNIRYFFEFDSEKTFASREGFFSSVGTFI
jgi:hypothetical protein